MKNIFLLVLIFFLSTFFVSAAQIESLERETLLAQVNKAQAPVTTDEYIIFTADSSARHVGIAFDFENFKTVHSFQRIAYHNEKNEIIDSLLFYILPKPESISTIKYRLVIDGLWTLDPLNPDSVYDQRTGLRISRLNMSPLFVPKTAVSPQTGVVRFIYEGESGETIRLAGSFNNWDSFMYEMSEVSTGLYQLDLPLPRGTYYYAFYSGADQLPDIKNTNRAYTKDGKIASIITVQ